MPHDLPQFLQGTSEPESAEKLTIQTNILSWPKIHSSLPSERHRRQRERMLKQYLIAELQGFRRKQILLRVFGALAKAAEYDSDERKEYREQLIGGLNGN